MRRNLNPCDDDANFPTIAKILHFPAMGTECFCCVGARIYLAFLVGLLTGYFF